MTSYPHNPSITRSRANLQRIRFRALRHAFDGGDYDGHVLAIGVTERDESRDLHLATGEDAGALVGRVRGADRERVVESRMVIERVTAAALNEGGAW